MDAIKREETLLSLFPSGSRPSPLTVSMCSVHYMAVTLSTWKTPVIYLKQCFKWIYLKMNHSEYFFSVKEALIPLQTESWIEICTVAILAMWLKTYIH